MAGNAEQTAEKPKKGLLSLLIWPVIGLVFGGAGFAVPMLAPGLFGAKADESQVEEKLEPVEYTPAYMEFGETTVNLNSEKSNRFLRVNITLEFDKLDEKMVTETVEGRKASLQSWLLSYLSDQGLEETKGRAGQNRLRREIGDYLNSELFDDGYDHIRDVLFTEFSVQ
ncbi:MAG: flagellar basal body-associated FliL family protein [Pirellulaceae bacterium]|nr:flagellar basal body-associated FliL family protein [Planctomycetales bacterium]